MDQKGYVMSGLSFLLMIPVVLLMATFVDMTHSGSESQSVAVQSDIVFYTAKDIKGNIPVMTEKILQNTTENVIETGDPLPDSSEASKIVYSHKWTIYPKNIMIMKV